MDRHALPRTLHTVETAYGAVKVKVAELGDGKVKSAPEYEDCRRLAAAAQRAHPRSLPGSPAAGENRIRRLTGSDFHPLDPASASSAVSQPVPGKSWEICVAVL